MRNLIFIVTFLLVLNNFLGTCTNQRFYRSFRPTLRDGIDITDSRGLMKKYCEISEFDSASVSHFNEYANHFHKQSPLECLKLLEKRDVTFGITLLRGLRERIRIRISESNMDPNELFLLYLFDIISYHLFSISLVKAKFQLRFEIVNFLAKLARKRISSFKFSGAKNDKYIDFEKKLTIYNFILNNISVDFANEIDNYGSLFRALNEIKTIGKSRNQSNEIAYFHFSKYIALIWFHIHNLNLNDVREIFDIEHHSKPIIIFLVLEFWGEANLRQVEFYPPKLESIFIELYKKGSLNPDPLTMFLKTNPPTKFCKYFKTPMYPSSYKELYHFSHFSHFADTFAPHISEKINIWLKIEAFTILEQYLSRNLLIKVDYALPQYFPEIKDSTPAGLVGLCAII
jgi:hypothetical protein